MDNYITRDKELHIKRFDYFVVFLLLCISGNPLVGSFTKYIYIISAVFLFVVSLNNKRTIGSPQLTRVLLFLLTLFFLQFIVVRDVSIAADINHLAKIYSGFLVVTLVGLRFRYCYFRLMTVICAISLIGFSFNVFWGSFPGIPVNLQVSVFLYNYIPRVFTENVLRNCGMFWEPGAFQGYIMLVFLMYMNEFNQFYKEHKYSFFILVAALITTFSTTGYIVFLLFLFIVLFGEIKKSPLAFVLICAVGVGAFIAFNSLDFLGDKIQNEYESAQYIRVGDVSHTRMGSAIIAWENVLRHPFIGNGFNMTALYGYLAEYMEGMGNGFFGAMNQLGIPFVLYYINLVYRNTPLMSIRYRQGFVLLIVLLLNGEFFLNYSLFWALLFVKYPKVNHQASQRIIMH